jgi:hypothetical protein
MKFNPTKFIGPEWSIESDNGFNPVSLKDIELTNLLKEGEKYITGEEILERIGERKALNADAFLRLWERQRLIPVSWHEAASADRVEFPGTVLRDLEGYRYFLHLHQNRDETWGWDCRWLGSDRDRDVFSAVRIVRPSRKDGRHRSRTVTS